MHQFKYVLAVAVSVIALASTGAVAQQPPSAISGAQKLMVVPASKYPGHVYVLPATLKRRSGDGSTIPSCRAW
jgi:hypothetical protein